MMLRVVSSVLLLLQMVNSVPQGSLRQKMFSLGEVDRESEILQQQIRDEALIQELDELVGHLDEEELEELQQTFVDDLEEEDEIELVIAKLKEMGLGEDDIEQLYRTALLIHEFINQVPNIASKLDLDVGEDLLDNILLYLLGLDNKLGPLGFIGLHHVLPEMTSSGEEGEIVDVIIEPIEESAGRQALLSQEQRTRRQAPSDPNTRKRRQLPNILQGLQSQAALPSADNVPWAPLLPEEVVQQFYP